MITVTSRDFGAWTNGIRLSAVPDAAGDTALPIIYTEAGAVSATYKPWTLTVENPVARAKYTYRIRCGLMLSGDLELSVNHTLREFTLEISGTVMTIVTADFDAVPTLKDLADWINSNPGASATVIGSAWIPSSVLNGGAIAVVEGRPRFFPAEEALAVYLLNERCPLVEATLAATSVANPADLTEVSNLFLSGGIGRGSDSVEAEGLTRALELAETTQAHLVFLQSASLDIQQLALLHCAEMCDVERRKYRILVTGINFLDSSPGFDGADSAATLDAAVAAACDRARALDGPCVLAFNGTISPNPVTGVSEQLGGLGLAAQVIGLAAGATVATPLTKKAVISQGLEFPYLKDSHIASLLDAGVLAVLYDSDSRRSLIEHALTCYQTANSSYRLFQGLRIQHQIARMWMRVLASYVGFPLDLETGERIKADCAKALDGAILSGNNPTGFLTDGRKNGERVPAWDSLRVVGDSTVGAWSISVNAHPVGETDIIVVRTKLTPAPIEL